MLCETPQFPIRKMRPEIAHFQHNRYAENYYRNAVLQNDIYPLHCSQQFFQFLASDRDLFVFYPATLFLSIRSLKQIFWFHVGYWSIGILWSELLNILNLFFDKQRLDEYLRKGQKYTSG